MFKKTLAAVAVLGAFAGTAYAANVTLYGIVDEALQYKYQAVQGGDHTDSYGMKSGGQASSRWGLKGQEELGNGLVAGFVLENGFNADDGKLANGGRLFGRAASVYLNGGFGTIAAGHDGALASGVGTVSYIYQYAAMSTGWGDLAASQKLFNFSYQDRADNAITYVSPDLGGVKLYAQYSFEANGTEDASANNNNRYAALGAQYKAGPFSTGLVVDMLKKSEKPIANPFDAREKAAKLDDDREDQYTVTYGASYDFEVAKVFGMVQYGKHMDSVVNGVMIKHPAFSKKAEEAATETDTTVDTAGLLQGDLEGWNIGLGASAPVLGGTVFAQVNYVTAKDKAEDMDAKVDGYGLAAAYSYPLSKRTSVYTYGSYSQFKNKGEDSLADGKKTKIGEFGLGLTHRF